MQYLSTIYSQIYPQEFTG